MGTLSVALKNIEVVRISYGDENKGYIGTQSHELLEGGKDINSLVLNKFTR